MRADETLFKGINVYFNRLWGKRGRHLWCLLRCKTSIFFFPAVIYEGMVTNGKAKRSEEGLCRAVPRQTFQTFNSSQKWIKLIKLVGNLHALKYSGHRYTLRLGLSHSNAEDTHSHLLSHDAKAQPVLMRASPMQNLYFYNPFFFVKLCNANSSLVSRYFLFQSVAAQMGMRLKISDSLMFFFLIRAD